MRRAFSWGEMAYQQHAGEGAPLVFLHGTGCDSHDWQAVLDRLPPDIPWLTLDFRAHGESSRPSEPFTLSNLADDMLALLAYLEVGQCWLVGHSLGGMVALAAAECSTDIVGLVLLEGWTRLAVVPVAFDGAHHLGGLSEQQIADIDTKYRNTRASCCATVWQAFWTSVQAADAGAYLSTTTIPIYEVYGTAGARPDAQHLLGVPERANITWRWLQGAGHYLPQTAPEEVSTLLRSIQRV